MIDLLTQSHDLIGEAELMRRMFHGDDLSTTAATLIEESKHDPNNAEALFDLSSILFLRGDRDLGLITQNQALQLKQRYTMQSRGEFKLLVLKAPGDFMINTPVEFLIKDTNISADILYIGPGLPYPTMVDYNLVFVAICEAEANLPILKMTEQLLKSWKIPYVNNPDEIPLLARERVCEIVDTISGIYMPQNITVSRDQLAEVASLQYQLSEFLVEDRFPIIARPFGTHAGQGLEKLSNNAEIQQYLCKYPDDKFYLAPYVDYRSRDGQFRKYRIVFIAGEPFLCHMAISNNWLIHYLNAGMTTNQSKRDEERQEMANFSNSLAKRHRLDFNSLCETVDLDYFGIDCAETSDGKLLIFELANAMVIHDMDPIDMFPYKKPAMQKAFNAFENMLFHKSGYNL